LKPIANGYTADTRPHGKILIEIEIESSSKRHRHHIQEFIVLQMQVFAFVHHQEVTQHVDNEASFAAVAVEKLTNLT
jgi:hypothetical protein